MPRFRPSLAATLFTLPAVALMLALGTWQLDRLAWKRDLIQRVEQRMAGAPVPLPPVIDEPAAWDFRPVTVTGRFLHDRAMLAVARPRQGQAGFELVTPLVPDDGGPAVLVNRGFVPMDRRSALPPGPDTVVTVRGIARAPQPPGFLQPDNRPGAQAWMRVDPPAMAAAAGLSAVAPVVVEALPTDGVPGGIEPRVSFANNHLQYAVTWYSLALVLVAVYVLFHLRRSPSAP